MYPSPSQGPADCTTQDTQKQMSIPSRYFPLVSSMQLELLLSQTLDLNNEISKKCDRGGRYGIQLTDLVSLTFAIIHSVRSVTVTEFQQNNSNDFTIDNKGNEKHGNHERNSNNCFLRIVGEVPDSIVSTVHANARCVVITAVASAMQWYLIRLLTYPLRPSSSSSPSLHSPSSRARSVSAYRCLSYAPSNFFNLTSL